MASATQTISTSHVTLRWVPLPEPIILPPPTQLITRTVSNSPLPCRRCLSDGLPGETMYLIPYNPFPPSAQDSPYQGPGPIYIHARECERYNKKEVSEQQTKRMLSVRAYNGEGMMVDYVTLGGEGLVEKAESMLGNEKVGYLMVHNSGPGCFAVKVEREIEGM